MKSWTHQVRVTQPDGSTVSVYGAREATDRGERLLGVGALEGQILADRGPRDARWSPWFSVPVQILPRRAPEVAPEDRRNRVVVWVYVTADRGPDDYVVPRQQLSEWADPAYTPRWGDEGLVMTTDRLAELVNPRPRGRR